MGEPGSDPIMWDTLKLSAEPLRARCGILVVAQVMVREQGQDEGSQYRVNFEINRQHGLVSYDTEVLASGAEGDGPPWRYSGRRDVLEAVKKHFLTTQLYSYVAGRLGWAPSTGMQVSQAPLDP